MSKLGVFSATEQKKLVAALSVDPTPPDERKALLEHCRWCAVRTSEGTERYEKRQLELHAAAKKISRFAQRILDVGTEAQLPQFVEAAEEIIAHTRLYKLTGRPHRGIFSGAEQLALCYLGASGKTTLARSRSGVFAEVLRIVYRVRDPLPIIEEIIKHGIVERCRKNGVYPKLRWVR